MTPLGGKSSESIENISFPFSLSILKQSIKSLYPDATFPSPDNNPFNAIAFADSIIFKQFPIVAEQQVIKTVEDDLKKIDRKNSPYKSLIYVSDGTRFKNPAEKMKFKSKIKSDFPIDIIPFAFFQSTHPLFNSPDLIDPLIRFKHDHNVKKITNNIYLIERIFKYVFSLPVEELPPVEPTEKQFLRLDKKIKANFYGVLKDDVNKDILSFWQVKMIIESYIKKNLNIYRPQFDAVKSKVLNSFLKTTKVQISNDAVNDLLIFENIADSILPRDLKDDYDAFGCAKAFVYYFFEYCLFGNKTELDESDPAFNFPVNE